MLKYACSSLEATDIPDSNIFDFLIYRFARWQELSNFIKNEVNSRRRLGNILNTAVGNITNWTAIIARSFGSVLNKCGKINEMVRRSKGNKILMGAV